MTIAPRPVRCRNALVDGSECQKFATVTGMQCVYDRQSLPEDRSDFVLKEIHYSAMCPKCGERKLIEKQ
jgi:hypothetical protein